MAKQTRHLLLSAVLTLSLLTGCNSSREVSAVESPVSPDPLWGTEVSSLAESTRESTPETSPEASPEAAQSSATPAESAPVTSITTTDTGHGADATQNRQLLESYYDQYTADNTNYDGLILSLSRSDRAWIEGNESVAPGQWPLWDFGVNQYPFARDESNYYLLSLPTLPDTDTSSSACKNSYRQTQLDTLDTLKDYAANRGLTLNPGLEGDYDTFMTRIWGNVTGGQTLTAQEYEENTASGDSVDPEIRSRVTAAFSTLGSYDDLAPEAMALWLSGDGSWMWEECRSWSWTATFDSDLNRYELQCTGPETDGTIPVQYLIVSDGQVISFPSGWLSAPGADEDAPES